MLRRMLRRVVALMTVAAIGCGPVAYINQVTLHADDAVEAAHAAHADKYSPYYWTRATQYLHMARVVAAHADYQGANRFGRLATEAAVKAKAEAEDPARRVDRTGPPFGGAAGQARPAGEPVPAKETVAPAKSGIAPAKDDAP